MGKCYSDAVERALEYLYYHEKEHKGQEALELLKQASEAGDGDATCILARCMCGSQYVWEGHGFPDNDKKPPAFCIARSSRAVHWVCLSACVRASCPSSASAKCRLPAFRKPLTLCWKRQSRATHSANTPLVTPISGGFSAHPRQRPNILCKPRGV